MRAVVQRVTRAEVRVGGESVARTGRGMVVLLGVMRGDGEREARRLAGRIARFRFFSDPRDARGPADARGARGEPGRMSVSALDAGASALVVSQVTLAADGRKGRRPSLDRAASPEEARALVDAFVSALREHGLECATGWFGAMMEVELVNDGPVTFVLDEAPAAE